MPLIGITGSAQAARSTFNPASVDSTQGTSKLVVWLRADTLNLADGAAVSTWVDIVNGRVYSNFSTPQPVFKTNVVNGNPVVRWDGTDSMCLINAGGAINQPLTIFVVGKQTAKTSEGRFLDDNSNGFHYGFSNSDGHFAINCGSWIGDGTTDHSGAFHIMSAVLNGASSNGWLEGAVPALDGTNPGTNGIAVISYVGGQGSNTGTTLNGDIAEILIYNYAMGDLFRGKVDYYLRQRYGFV